MEYLRRMADVLLAEHLEAFGATLIEGPKWCGKTTTAEQKAASVLKLQDPDTRAASLATAATKPSLLLKGDTPRLIDEWQDAPVLWDAVRTMVDNRQDVGQFILTGSNSVDKSKIFHSGTGRISRMKMYPMSLYESLESTGEVSLKELFDNPKYDIDGKISRMSVEDLIFAACRGGWPASLKRKTKQAKLLIAKEYIDSICISDISRVDNIQRDPDLMRLILRTYARNISTLALKSTMLKDVKSNFESCSDTTLDSYLLALKRLFVIEDVDAWCPAVRSATVIRKTPKRDFIDPSIAVAALGLSPNSLEMDLRTFGFLFECMCVRDFRAYSQSIGSHIEYYHDRYGLEADLVLHLNDGRYALIECKLGSAEIEMAASHLLELKNLIKEYNKKEKQLLIREPDLLIVVTGGQLAYTRDDGVKIIPLGCLKD
jgi:predicted AAA+ superfamily ATPase